MGGIADFRGAVIEQLELADENDKVAIEIVLCRENGKSMQYPFVLTIFVNALTTSGEESLTFGSAEMVLPGDGSVKDDAFTVKGAGDQSALVFLKASWVE